ncbi:MAG TPA: L,D-transpeptidase family protein [Polyangiaceae bacterium]|nr:L,D-transpeptidase family protein [Polyangiaceae bacterium]
MTLAFAALFSAAAWAAGDQHSAAGSASKAAPPPAGEHLPNRAGASRAQAHESVSSGGSPGKGPLWSAGAPRSQTQPSKGGAFALASPPASAKRAESHPPAAHAGRPSVNTPAHSAGEARHSSRPPGDAQAQASKAGPVEEFKIPGSCRQLLTVRSKHWDAVSGELRRYVRASDSEWKLVGDVVPVNVGRRGMAWGRGLQGEPPIVRRKRDRDLRAPAGVFALGTAFGYAPDLEQNAKKYPYLPIRANTACVEQIDSEHYNRIIDTSQTASKRWELRSEMLRPDGLFRWGVVVRQNEPDPRPGAGSCIFMHIWRGPKQGTAGCTAMEPANIQEVIHWLDPAASPVLVQLPEPEYEKYRSAWQLPP